MIDLRERLQELANAAIREGATLGAAHAIRRGRQRRRRIIGGVASLLIIALAVGGASIGHLPDQMDTRPLVPVTPTPSSNPEVTRNPPSSPKVTRKPPSRSTLRDDTFHLLATELRRCPGGASIPADQIGYIWSERYRALLMVAAKQPPAQETRFCWTVGWAGQRNPGGGLGARRVGDNNTPLTFTGNIESGFAQIAGRVTKQATRLRLRFRDGRPPTDLEIIQSGDRYPVNFYAGFFAQGPTSPEQGGWAAATLTALDSAGRPVATCRVGPPGDGMPKCPGN
jgi:hypothetical protein